MSLVDIEELSYGNIICCCELADCILMTAPFIEEIQKNRNEYVSGIYAPGRYAWILRNTVVFGSANSCQRSPWNMES